MDWSKSHCGVMLCSYEKTIALMPEVKEIIDKVIPYLELPLEEYVIDVKIHMLMPDEYPCIPNWHRDFVPRDANLNMLNDKITGEKMYLWVSGEPYTEFKSKPKELIDGWIEFTQNHVHRGIKSKIHTWRCFIRITPKKFIHPTTVNIGELRRHSQVYIDNPERFRW